MTFGTGPRSGDRVGGEISVRGRPGTCESGRGKRDVRSDQRVVWNMALSGLEIGRWLDQRGPRLTRTVASELCVAGFRRVCPCRSPSQGSDPAVEKPSGRRSGDRSVPRGRTSGPRARHRGRNVCVRCGVALYRGAPALCAPLNVRASGFSVSDSRAGMTVTHGAPGVGAAPRRHRRCHVLVSELRLDGVAALQARSA